jgi:hypothetical protein
VNLGFTTIVQKNNQTKIQSSNASNWTRLQHDFYKEDITNTRGVGGRAKNDEQFNELEREGIIPKKQ